MNIGFVSTWFERGAAYVTKSYISLLEKENNVYVYARGGEQYGKGDPNWDLPYVTWGLNLRGDSINYRHFKKWIKKNNIEIIFFNEQKNVDVIHKLKKNLPHIKIGSYIDYYKENTVKEFFIYDFLICNTKRHYSVFKNHPQCYYVPWGTDIEIFKPAKTENEKLTFFHSAGMSLRKGTEIIIEAFIDGQIYKNANLIIHTQRKLKDTFGYDPLELQKYNIKVIEKTVSAPGLYYLGDVYLYPTKLDGLGLTLYEALSSGLPIITTNHPPMNEIVNRVNGYLVDVDYFRSRQDGYYWPLAIVKKESLINGMQYFVDNQHKLKEMKKQNRKEAITKWNWKDREKIVNEIFQETKIIVKNPDDSLIYDNRKITKVYNKIGSSYLYSLVKRSRKY